MLGEVIHGYLIDRAMSEDKGGFGDVFFATHVDSGAEAVIKMLKPEMSALHDMVERFFNEARAAASIHHPGIVQIHNVGYHRDRAYLLMERLRGDDLETRLLGGPLPIDRAVTFIRQTAGAIGAAHDRGIVHRDLKPANLFIVADPDVVGGERVKVLDFGIAKLTADVGAGKTQGVFGTPPYMSPEQCASTAAVDGRSDLYSLGCIFYELVSGRPPFGQGGIELIAAHLRDTPPPPRTHAPWLPPAIEHVILGLLEKQPDRRIPSCAALVRALDEAALASGLSVGVSQRMPASSPAVSAQYLPRTGSTPSTLVSAAGAVSTQPQRRRGLGVWLGLGAVVVVGGAVAALTVTGGKSHGPQPRGADDAGVVVVVPMDAAAGRDAEAIAIVPFDAELRALPLDAGVVAVALDAAVGPDAGTPRRGGFADRAAALITAGNAAMHAAPPRYDDAIARYREAAALTDDPEAFFYVGDALFAAGRYGEAQAVLEPVARTAPRSIAAKANTLLAQIAMKKPPNAHDPPPDTLTASDKAAQAAKLNGDAKQAMYEDHYDEALALFQRSYELEPRPQVLVNIGVAQLQSHRCDDARKSFIRVMATWPHEPAADKAKQLLTRVDACK